MIPPPDATLETFTPHVGQVFVVRSPDGAATTVTLVEATPTPTDGDPRRTRVPFSLVFHASADHGLGQGMYQIERDGFGALDIFLVPILPDRRGARIQAIFA
jgi:hypothetical protein